MRTIREILNKIKKLEGIELKEYLINIEENYQIELKKSKNSFPKEALESYSAFANTDGGLLILGIEETSTGLNISGVKSPDKVKKEMFDILNNSQKVSKNIITDQNIVEKIIDDKVVIIIDVPKAYYKDKPVYLNNNPKTTFKRNYEGDYRCTEQEMIIMIQDSSNESLDNSLLENFTIDDLDPEAIRSYRQRFSLLKSEHPFTGLSDQDFLIKLKVLRKNRRTNTLELTLGGLLVFGKSEAIKERLPHFHVEYIDKSDLSHERWSDRLVYDGTWEDNLYNFFYLAINRIYNNLEKNFKILEDNITREELSEVHIALREAFINSIIHANFELEQPIKVTKYPNYFQFENPGTLRISKEDFFEGEHSDPRNHIIQEIFRHLNLCERAGSGIPKILKAVKDYSYKHPDIEEDKDKFTFKFWNIEKIEDGKKQIESLDDLNKIEKDLLIYLLTNKTISNKDVQENFHLTKNQTTKLFNKLVEKKYIKKLGIGRGTFYKIAIDF
ncbi:ATP-binding protein [Psychrilyobacter atlanticus]|uniref:ATP-binding protein n=1 Tax=Psychrilyobacter atlanticus TaxID=271091 RepID=UPI00041D7A38|nr:ATP-binding protein [Psychrilyobacter atlanticus]